MVSIGASLEFNSFSSSCGSPRRPLTATMRSPATMSVPEARIAESGPISFTSSHLAAPVPAVNPHSGLPFNSKPRSRRRACLNTIRSSVAPIIVGEILSGAETPLTLTTRSPGQIRLSSGAPALCLPATTSASSLTDITTTPPFCCISMLMPHFSSVDALVRNTSKSSEAAPCPGDASCNTPAGAADAASSRGCTLSTFSGSDWQQQTNIGTD
mmetsp:Transcript_71944/g.208413  ORF Transcript_71944/g.208413 Transcript_71944/m.208413 type:complete len:213 (-) Transcript_71944:76-714(-)